MPRKQVWRMRLPPRPSMISDVFDDSDNNAVVRVHVGSNHWFLSDLLTQDETYVPLAQYWQQRLKEMHCADAYSGTDNGVVV